MRDLTAARSRLAVAGPRVDAAWAAELGSRPAPEILAEVVERFHPQLALACSFQKEESVLVDMLLTIEPAARVFTLDTGVLFPDTRDVWRAFERRYGIEVEVYDSLPDDGQPWTAQRCCSERKVAALGEALVGLDAWITGLRREQAPTRADVPKVSWEPGRGLWKVNPLADWTEGEVWSYIEQHEVPYHPLHDQGYASIGCAPCTAPGSGREGRWAGTDKTECGLHVEPAGDQIEVAATALRRAS
jgi:phosphoadenosine phosphosulfate reductase